MQTKTIRRSHVVALLAMLLVLAAALALILTFLGSADEPIPLIDSYAAFPCPGESLDSDSASMKFYFLIGTLDFIRAGFSFSKTNTFPTAYASDCTVCDTTVSYSSVTVNGNVVPAPTGRRWIEVELSDVPQADYTEVIYFNAFVEDENTVTYGTASAFTVCAVFGHDNLEGGKILRAPTDDDPGLQEYHCDLCGDFVGAVDLDAYNAEILRWQTQVATFRNSDFGSGSVTTDLAAAAGYSHDDPPVDPTVGQHPRVLFNASDVPGIRTALENAPQTVKDAYYVAAYDDRTWGTLGPADPNRLDGEHNFDATKLVKLQMLALDYQLTGNKGNGYLAIYAMKNYLKCLDVVTMDGDYERAFGFVMYTAACVYDWCYDLMTPTDKEQIVFAVQKKCCEGKNKPDDRMEMGFPPHWAWKGQGPITGHACEFQLLRDYLSFAIAIYDEYPGWWDFIGGLFYQKYVPVRNEIYKAGMSTQGVSLYLRIRFTADLYSAALIKAMSGSIPYDEEGMRQVMRTVYSYELPYGNSFESGDNRIGGKAFQDYGRASLISSYLFEDQTIRANLESHGYSYSVYSEKFKNYTVEASPGEYLIFSSNAVEPTETLHEGMPLILYNGGWLGQIIARNTWSNSQAAVLMKIGVRTVANHDHADAGQFQIYYKTMLAGDTGVYDTYLETHRMRYHAATIAHNCLLIKKGSGTYNVGGQRLPDSTGNFNGGGDTAWLTSDTYKTGTVTGYRYAYADGTETEPLYAYIAGDITPAYDSSVVSEVTRRMLTVFDTDNADVPLFFIVFDNVTGVLGSYKKTFLLHVPAEPTISGNTVTVVKSGGKLVLQNVFGGDSINAVGGVVFDGNGKFVSGSSSNYSVNGNQLTPTKNSYDGYWGRVEISPTTGSATDQFLNVMYVCDANKTPSNVTATAISNNFVKGARIGNTAAVFVTNRDRRTSAFTFSAPGSGNVTYYVSGVESGDWTVSVNGNVVSTTDAAGGLLVFTAPAGNVTLTPTNLTRASVGEALGASDWSTFDYSNLLP